MSISRKLFLIIVFAMLFAFVSIFGVHQVSKGALFHQLNSLHLKYTIELRDHLVNWRGSPVELKEIERTINLIQYQPIKCLNNINKLDEFVMTQIGTESAIQNCKDDIEVSSQILNSIQKYKDSQISLVDIDIELKEAAKRFLQHSSGFEKNITKTVDFIKTTFSYLIILLAIAVIGAIGAMVRSISMTVIKREQAEEALLKSETRFRSMVENAGDAIYIHDRYGKIHDINQVACDQLGYTHEELLELSVAQLDVAVDFENLRDTWDIGEADSSKFPLTLETAHRRKDGTTFPIEVRISLLPNDGSPLLIAMVRDITDRKRTENSLSDKIREVNFQKFALDEHAIVSITDVKGNITYVNDKFCEVSGYSKEELMGKNHRFVKSDEHSSPFYADLWENIANGKVWHGIIKNQKKNGDPYWVDATIVPSLDDQGQPFQYVAIRTDITERKIVEKTLQESEERLSSAIENIADGFVLFDQDDRLVVCNKQYRKLFPSSHDLIVPGATFKDIIQGGAERGEYPDSEGRINEWVAERIEKRNSSKIHEMHLIGDRWVRAYDKKLPNGMSVGVRVDITELRQAKETADKANRSKSDFLSSMSHELRTPMNAILGFGQMLEYIPHEPLAKTQKQCVDSIMKGGKHLLDLINDILDLAQIEAGKVELSIEDISPNSILEECLPLVSAMAEKSGINISIQNLSETTPRVRADYIRLKQVLLNLMSNAIKYNRDNGEVIVSSLEADNGNLRISVRDTGEGIPEDKQSELFKPFSRLGAENTEIEGTGIGLVVCNDLIKIMDGTIGMESTLGEGSTFWFELPMATSTRDSSEKALVMDASALQTKGALPSLKGTLLYVEDNPENLKLMELIVSYIEGLTMISARTGELGIELARSKKPDIIILDINLPGMNGIEVLKKLSRYKNTKNIPTLALSAAATKSDIKKGIDAGFKRYLTKPVQVSEFVDALKEALKEDK